MASGLFVCQTIHQKGGSHFNPNVSISMQYLRVVLNIIPQDLFWGHRGFWHAVHNFYARDGVHLNNKGQKAL